MGFFAYRITIGNHAKEESVILNENAPPHTPVKWEETST